MVGLHGEAEVLWTSLLALQLMLIMAGAVQVGGAREDEMSALVEFFRGINSSTSESSSCVAPATAAVASAPDVEETGSGACRWCGVSCAADGRVVAVEVAGQGLRGRVRPKSLAKLQGLSTLDLSHNQLSGMLPDDLGTLSNLTTLDLSHNAFSGPIPSSFGGLNSLRNFSLAVNQLQGAIPASLGALHRLLSLNLSSNFLSDAIPVALSRMESLKVLDLHGNQLSGEIDPAFLGLSSLASVDLSSNNLSGFLPWQPNDTLPLLRSLQYVNLSNNQLTGPLAPARFASVFAEKLQVLDMSHNQLSGNLPDFEFVIGLVMLRLNNNLFSGAVPPTLLSMNLGLLQELDLSNNHLTGEITRVLSTSLAVLNVSYNMLTGMIPQKIGSCSVLDLSNNDLSGDLSYMHYWSDMLEVLDLSFNHLRGELIDEVSRFVRLRCLDLSQNALFGSIPPDYGLFPKLTYVDLSFNHLNGTVPASFFSSFSLLSLSLSSNELGGGIQLPANVLLDYPSDRRPLPISGQLYSRMIMMDLSNNKLDGKISEGIGNLQNLKAVNFSNNNLSGPLPNSLCNLTVLQELDVSSNSITGPIPGALPNTLVVLHLSNNNLSGLIPENLERFPESTFFPGNSGLASGWAFTSGSKSPPLLSSHTKDGVHRAGLIGGCTAGSLLILVLGLFVYHRSVSKSAVYGTSDKANISKICNTCAAHVFFCQSHSGTTHPGASSSVGLLSERATKSTTALQRKAPPLEGKSAWEQAPKSELDEFSRMSVQETSSSARSRHNLPPESILHHEPLGVAEEFLQIDTSKILKVQSPDRLAGDLHFLDKSLRFSAEELSRAPAEVLGRSSHGTTYKATLDNGHLLTVKWLREGLAKNRKEFAREAKKFAKVRHPNLNPLKGYYWGPREHEKLILSDFATSGSLADRMERRCSAAPFSWQQRLGIAVDVARGLVYLHEDRHMPHGNLKAANVLMAADGSSARLADYSLHLLMTAEGTTSQILNAGALGYRAPELATKPKPTLKGDVYALGVLLLELLTGKGAGDIISGQSGAVDLTDWVRLLASEKRVFECFDPPLLPSDGTEAAGTLLHHSALEALARLALTCISHDPSQRPNASFIYGEISSLHSLSSKDSLT